MSVTLDLAGRRVLVTGAGSGIGLACAERLAAAGAHVVATDINADAANTCAEAINAAGGRAVGAALDVSDQTASEQLAETLAADGPVSGLVNCAATWTLGRFLDTDPAVWQRELQVNLAGVMLVTRALLPQMSGTGRGTVVNVSSDAGRIGERRQVAYSAAKAGMIGFTKALAKEVGRERIRVNCVAPGLVRTPASAAFIERLDMDTALRAYPLGRIGEPEDVADLVLFLTSDLSSWITGQVISVDGGYTMAG